MDTNRAAAPQGNPLMPNWRLVSVEIAIILLVALIATRQYLSPNPDLVQTGSEAEWMTNSAFMAATGFHEQGRIPLWQPYLNRGEPALERPLSFVLNPISIGPSLIFGAEVGVRYSVVLYAILAGVGGWVLGWVMGMGSPTRVLLGLLMIGLGNMPALIASGNFQLGVAQAFFPWLVAGSIAVSRFRHSRAPVALIAIALMLMIFGGGGYFVIPGVIIVATLAIAFSIHRASGRLTVDFMLIGRYLTALLLPIPLATVLLIPTVVNQAYNGITNLEDPNNLYVNPLTVLSQFFSTNRTFTGIEWNKSYELIVVPLWSAALFFVVLPLVIRRFPRPLLAGITTRIAVVGVVLSLFFLLWGTGTNPIMRWALESDPLFAHWLFLSRMLTLVSLFLSLIVAMQFDSIWRAVMLDASGSQVGGLSRFIAGSALIVLIFLATGDSVSKYNQNVDIRTEDANTVWCLTQLRARQPQGEISLLAEDYNTITPFLRHHIRFTFFSNDNHPVGITPTLFPHDLRQNIARYFIFGDDGDRIYWSERGFQFVPDIFLPESDRPCFMEYAKPLPYAFAISRDDLVNYTIPENYAESVQTRFLRAEDVIPLTRYTNLTDHMALTVVASPSDEIVVTVQELAWSGWTVTVDGQPAPLESIGYMIGVVLPADGAAHDILFRYDAPQFRQGAVISLASFLLVSLWLLRVDRLIFRRGTAANAPVAEPKAVKALARRPALQMPPGITAMLQPKRQAQPEHQPQPRSRQPVAKPVQDEAVLPFIGEEPMPPYAIGSEDPDVIPFDE